MGDDSRCARLVLDDHRLAEGAGEAVARQSCDHVTRRAQATWHDELDRPRRPALRFRRAGPTEQQRAEQQTTPRPHIHSPICRPSLRTARPNALRSWTRNASTSWVGLGSTPCLPSASRVFGSSSAASVSLRISETISAGVPFGSSSTVQLASSNSGTPASLKVGTL